MSTKASRRSARNAIKRLKTGKVDDVASSGDENNSHDAAVVGVPEKTSTVNSNGGDANVESEQPFEHDFYDTRVRYETESDDDLTGLCMKVINPQVNEKPVTSTKVTWGELDKKVEVDYPTFKGSQHGPVKPLEKDAKPIEFFDRLFPSELWDVMVSETNRHAKNNNVVDWQNVTSADLKLMIGILYGTSVIRPVSLSQIWNSEWSLGLPQFAQRCDQAKFWHIYENINLVNELTVPPRHDPAFDKAYPVRPMLNMLNRSFSESFNMNQNICVDKTIVKSKNKNPMTQTVSDESFENGAKLWCLGCSCCGYLSNISIDMGKYMKVPADEKDPSSYFTKKVVLNQIVPMYSGLNHVVYLDSFLTSFSLLQELQQHDTFTVGIIKSETTGYPVALQKANLRKSMARGDYHTISNNNTTVTLWKDNKHVSFVSNVHSSHAEKETGKKRNADGSLKKPSHSFPPLLTDFRKNIAGVYKNEYMMKSCAIDRETSRWWMRIFFYLLDVVRMNAYIMYKVNYLNICKSSELGNETDSQPMSLIEFTGLIVKHLCGSHTIRNPARHNPGIQPEPCMLRFPGHESRKITDLMKNGRCQYCSMGPNRCRRAETSYGCRKCGVRLCRTTCHERYHERHFGRGLKGNIAALVEEKVKDKLKRKIERQDDFKQQQQLWQIIEKQQQQIQHQHDTLTQVQGDRGSHSATESPNSLASPVPYSSYSANQQLTQDNNIPPQICIEVLEMPNSGENESRSSTSKDSLHKSRRLSGVLKSGKCHMCSLGPNRFRRAETCFGCHECKVRLCRDGCHDLYHANLKHQSENPQPPPIVIQHKYNTDDTSEESTNQSVILNNSSLHQSEKITDLMKKGRCTLCSMGPRKCRRAETCYGCRICRVRLCRVVCHEQYHAERFPDQATLVVVQMPEDEEQPEIKQESIVLEIPSVEEAEENDDSCHLTSHSGVYPQQNRANVTQIKQEFFVATEIPSPASQGSGVESQKFDTSQPIPATN
ncbi:uncharacterized protein LOC144361667, partial [Saccoglossus kowalevskii]